MLCPESRDASHALTELMWKPAPMKEGSTYGDWLDVKVMPHVLAFNVHSFKMA